MQNSYISKAKDFAIRAHAGQEDKLGISYIHHLEDVARRVADKGEIYEAVAWLHDCVEDTPTTIADVKAAFGFEVAEAVNAMTRREGEVYFQDYIPRLKANPIAAVVKLADASHNLDKTPLLAKIDPDRAASLSKRYERVIEILNIENSH